MTRLAFPSLTLMTRDIAEASTILPVIQRDAISSKTIVSNPDEDTIANNPFTPLKFGAFGDALLTGQAHGMLSELVLELWENLANNQSVASLYMATAMADTDQDDKLGQAQALTQSIATSDTFSLINAGRMIDLVVGQSDHGLIELTSELAEGLIHNGPQGLAAFLELAGIADCVDEFDGGCIAATANPTYPTPSLSAAIETFKALESTRTAPVPYLNRTSPRGNPDALNFTAIENAEFEDNLLALYEFEFMLQALFNHPDQFTQLLENGAYARAILEAALLASFISSDVANVLSKDPNFFTGNDTEKVDSAQSCLEDTFELSMGSGDQISNLLSKSDFTLADDPGETASTLDDAFQPVKTIFECMYDKFDVDIDDAYLGIEAEEDNDEDEDGSEDWSDEYDAEDDWDDTEASYDDGEFDDSEDDSDVGEPTNAIDVLDDALETMTAVPPTATMLDASNTTVPSRRQR